MHIRRTLPLLVLCVLCVLCGCAHHTVTARNPPPPPILAPTPPPEPVELSPPPPPPPPEPEAMAEATTSANPNATVAHVSGTVTDATGAAIPGTTVSAINASTSYSATTNAEGQYTLPALPPGVYYLKFTSPGFQSTVLPGSAIVAGRSSTINATLQIGQSTMAAMVTAAAPQNTREKVDTWFKHLPQGAIKYNIDDKDGKMVLQQTYTATAIIYPPGITPPPDTPSAASTSHANSSPAAAQAAAAQQPQPLAVSTWMRVSLTQPDNPGTFEITPAIGPCLFVSMAAPTPWTFQVKPLHGGGDKSLVFTAYVVYGDDADSCPENNPATIELPTNRQTVHIQEVSMKVLKQQAEDSFWQDPVGWFKKASKAVKWGLPGGAGFIAISSFIAWWKKRRQPPKP
jgi:hypothetical protein